MGLMMGAGARIAWVELSRTVTRPHRLATGPAIDGTALVGSVRRYLDLDQGCSAPRAARVDAFSGEHSGRHTEDVATKSGIDREAQDAWAARSQTRFAKAQATGAFDAQITPVEIKSRKGVEAFARDEAPRAGTSIETLAKLKPAFRKDGTITAGNAPGLNSGAAAMIVAERNVAETNGLDAFGRLDAYGVGAGEPDLFGLGPLPAVRQVPECAGWLLGDLERVEINEAFAVVPLAVAKELGLLEDITTRQIARAGSSKAFARRM